MTELVSVVIPVYNGETYLAAAVESVLRQTHPSVECVVVDDGSTDRSGEIADGLSAAEPGRVRVVHTENRGVAAARNCGIAAARADLVAFLDADDLWLPAKLERQLIAFRARPEAGIVYTGVHLVDAHGRYIGRMRAAPPAAALRNTLLMERPPLILTTGLVPRQVLDAIGGFDERLSTSADCDLACRIALRHDVTLVDEPLALWRQHGSGMHLDPSATRHDMQLVHDKVFNDPNLPVSLRRQRRRASANLQISLAGTYWRRGDRRQAVQSGLRAARCDPTRLFAAARRLTRPGGPEGMPPHG